MSQLGARQEIYRASCNGVEVRLRVNVDSAWVVIRQPAQESFYCDIAENKIAAVLAEFRAIGGDPQRFRSFVTALICLATPA